MSEPKPWTVDFDVSYEGVAGAIFELTTLLVEDHSHDHSAQLLMRVFGPAGGNPNLVVTGKSLSLYKKVQDWVTSNNL